MIYQFFLNIFAFFYGFSLLMRNNVLLRYFFLSILIVVIGLNILNQLKFSGFKMRKINENPEKINLSLFFQKHSFFFLLFIFFNFLSLAMNDYSFNEIRKSGIFWFHEFIFLYFLSLFFRLSINALYAFFIGLLSGVYISSLVAIIQYVTRYQGSILKYIKHYPSRLDFAGWGFQPPGYELIPDFIPRVSGFFLNPNIYAYSLSLALIAPLTFLFLKKPIQQKILVFLIFFTGIISLVMTYSRGAWITFTIGVFWFLYMIKKRLIFSCIFFFIVIGVFLFYLEPGFKEKVSSIWNPNYTSNQQRMEIMTGTYKTFIDNPLWGVGLYKNKQLIFHKDNELGYRMEVTNAHNMYLEVLAGTGLFGFLSLMAFFITVLGMTLRFLSFKNQKNLVLWVGLFTTLIVFLVGGLFCVALKINEIRSIFFAFLSILFFMWEEQKMKGFCNKN